jgi:hypothetical protein
MLTTLSILSFEQGKNIYCEEVEPIAIQSQRRLAAVVSIVADCLRRLSVQQRRESTFGNFPA